jgi:hypothetical protein
MESWIFNPAPAMASSSIHSLCLYPLSDRDHDREHLHISLPSGECIMIGRTRLKDTDVYFDSKSLSRHHAQVWGEDGKVRLVQLILCLIFDSIGGRYTSRICKAQMALL